VAESRIGLGGPWFSVLLRSRAASQNRGSEDGAIEPVQRSPFSVLRSL
jgi:hypothetical protein